MSYELNLSHISNFRLDDPYKCTAFVHNDIAELQQYLNKEGKLIFTLSDDWDFMPSQPYPTFGVYAARVVNKEYVEVYKYCRQTNTPTNVIEWSPLLGNIYVSQVFEVYFTAFNKPPSLVSMDSHVTVSQFTAKPDTSFFNIVRSQTFGNKVNTSPGTIFVTYNNENPTPGKYQVQITRAQKVNYTMDSINILERID